MPNYEHIQSSSGPKSKAVSTNIGTDRQQHQAVDTLKDIYPNQERGILESVLKSFDYNVSKAVQWFVDYSPENSPAKGRFPTGTNAIKSHSDLADTFDFDDFLNEQLKADHGHSTDTPVDNDINEDSLPLPVIESQVGITTAVTSCSNPGTSTSQKSSNSALAKKAKRDAILFSVENLLKAHEEGQSASTRFSGHSKFDENDSDEETASLPGNCLSFSKSPINKPMKLTRGVNMKENHPAPLLQAGVKRSSTDKLCRFCGTVTSDIFCANCENVVNKRNVDDIRLVSRATQVISKYFYVFGKNDGQRVKPMELTYCKPCFSTFPVK